MLIKLKKIIIGLAILILSPCFALAQNSGLFLPENPIGGGTTTTTTAPATNPAPSTPAAANTSADTKITIQNDINRLNTAEQNFQNKVDSAVTTVYNPYTLLTQREEANVYKEEIKQNLILLAKDGYDNESNWNLRYEKLHSKINELNAKILATNNMTNTLTGLVGPQINLMEFGEEFTYDQYYKNPSAANTTLGTMVNQSEKGAGQIDCDNECGKDLDLLGQAARWLGGTAFASPVCSLVCGVTNAIIGLMDFINNLFITSTI